MSQKHAISYWDRAQINNARGTDDACRGIIPVSIAASWGPLPYYYWLFLPISSLHLGGGIMHKQLNRNPHRIVGTRLPAAGP